ncbi:uncharacterized protein BDV17DRAFT_182783 [Aspergillus undulatus]|uniref:uncharacterized protein n=1 Tax=Aspergillus undulatus TaxID=1810928 RepID=UPI003CCD74F3
MSREAGCCHTQSTSQCSLLAIAWVEIRTCASPATEKLESTTVSVPRLSTCQPELSCLCICLLVKLWSRSTSGWVHRAMDRSSPCSIPPRLEKGFDPTSLLLMVMIWFMILCSTRKHVLDQQANINPPSVLIGVDTRCDSEIEQSHSLTRPLQTTSK